MVVKPIPIAFHIGPLEVHTYGIGLAITFWFAYRYFARRLRAHGYSDSWLGKAFVWIIAAAIVGARLVHVLANLSMYVHDPVGIFAVWHGGLSSFGGLAFGVPTGFYVTHRWCKELKLSVAADIVAPVLVLAWAVGRLLGPQLMIAGGGRRTNAWYGMYYAGEVGKRVPVPIIQAIECFVIWLILMQVEKLIARRGSPLGLLTTGAVTLWGLSRFFDEYIWLPHGGGGDAVEVAALAFVGAGIVFGVLLLWRDRRALASGKRPLANAVAGDPWANPAPALAAEAAGDGSPAGATGVDGDGTDQPVSAEAT